MRDIDRAAAGLFLAWCANDLEELLTMAPGSVEAFRLVPDTPLLPAPLRERGLSQAHVNLGIGIMGAVVASAAIAGSRTAGRSAWFRGGTLAFGLHGVGHLAASIAARGYTTGVLTSPTVVIPAWLWARRILARHGLSDHDRSAIAVAVAALGLIPAVHVLTFAILRERSLGPEAPPTAGQVRRGFQ